MKILPYIILIILICTFSYLAFATMEADFNIRNWETVTRTELAAISSLGAIIIVTIRFALTENNK